MKNAVVIGASSGIGRALAEKLLADGCRVGVMARRTELLNEIVEKYGDNAVSINIDISSRECCEALRMMLKKMGKVDLAVISSGTGFENEKLELDPELATINTNVTGFTCVANILMQHFMENGRGHLVGITSIAALRGSRGAPAYNATKAFQANYLEGLRQKAVNSKLDIAVTDVRPGFVDTDMAKGEGLFWVAPVEKAAAQIYSAIKKKKSVVYVTRRWNLIACILRNLPGFIYNRL